MKTRPKEGDRFAFRYQFDVQRYGNGLVVESVQNVYPSKAHPGPAFVTWVKARTDNGTEISRQLGDFVRETRAIQT